MIININDVKAGNTKAMQWVKSICLSKKQMEG